MYGDSAYVHAVDVSHIAAKYVNATGELAQTNECMSSCRECIEWHYGELISQWKMIDFSKGLKLRYMDVPCMILNAMLLRNAYACMNGNKTSEYFNCPPPSFEIWVQKLAL